MSVFRIAVAFAAGAAAMYYFDPIAGRRRRALVRDQGVAARHDLEDLADAKVKRATDRVRGTMAEARGRMSDEPISDERLHARIRAELGRLVDKASAVKVEVHDGNVALSGRVSAEEIDALVEAVEAMQGVESVANRLVVGSQAPQEPQGGQNARH
jgi:BON domain-containing protein